MNLYNDIPSFADETKWHFHVVVEITKGSSNKVEYNEEKGYFALDRVLYHSMFYPFDYGFIPQTSAGDGDAVDVCLLVTHPTFPGCVVKARAIGTLVTKDQDGEDYKVIAVPVSKLDPRRDEVQTIDDLPKHVQEEISIYFKEYKRLEKEKYDKIEIGGFIDTTKTLAHIKEAQATWQAKHH